MGWLGDAVNFVAGKNSVIGKVFDTTKHATVDAIKTNLSNVGITHDLTKSVDKSISDLAKEANLTSLSQMAKGIDTTIETSPLKYWNIYEDIRDLANSNLILSGASRQKAKQAYDQAKLSEKEAFEASMKKAAENANDRKAQQKKILTAGAVIIAVLVILVIIKKAKK